MSDLAASVESLKRVVARPGTFSSFFPETTDTDLQNLLLDGLAECMLDGLFLTYTYTGTVVSPDLTSGETALVVLTAGIRLIRAELFNRVTSRTYKAGPAEFSETVATNVMRDIMKALEAKRNDIITIVQRGSVAHAFSMADSYIANAFGPPPCVPFSYGYTDWTVNPATSWWP